ncbi:hypothetical protein PROVALCAL_01415 [Providencia alcalifaciens DSM 30120]|uniref:Uncharacterized protein n=1 Tax=Providencia alcalifaciens DSM 30120 TaxID=520999 RepID=B6XDJ3_9GAMM|nr:hypothetical protein PROVALCAL_01415 [Providencia alcalifaciens DSM 30120]
MLQGLAGSTFLFVTDKVKATFLCFLFSQPESTHNIYRPDVCFETSKHAPASTEKVTNTQWHMGRFDCCHNQVEKSGDQNAPFQLLPLVPFGI